MIVASASASPVFAPASGSPVTVANSAFSTDPAVLPFAVAFSPNGRLLATGNLVHSVSVFGVGAGGVLTEVAGSPFDSGTGAGTSVNAIAFSPDGRLLATATSANSVVIFSVGAGGALTPVATPPRSVGTDPESVAFNSTGGLLAVGNVHDNTVSVFTVDSDGTTTEVMNSPFPTGAFTSPYSVTFSPIGDLLATADSGTDGGVGMFSVGAGGQLTAAAGAPFTAGRFPESVSFSPDGKLLATASQVDQSINLFSVGAGGVLTDIDGSPFAEPNAALPVALSPQGLLASARTDNSVSVYAPAAGGALSPVDGSPFTVDDAPHAVAFSPDGTLLATVAPTKSTLSVLTVAPPSASIATPLTGQTFVPGQVVATSFSCAEAPYGSGIASCTDSAGATGVGALDTTTLGPHTYTVTATSQDGQHASASVGYTVVAAPVVAPPVVAPPARTAQAPRISALKLSQTRFKPAKSGPTIGTSRSAGTTVSYRDSLAATTSFAVRRCVGRHASCSKVKSLGSFTHNDSAGADHVRFTGRIDRHAMTRGRYELRATAAFHGRRSTAVTATFTIV